MADTDAFDWEGRTVLDSAGDKVGKIEEIFLVEETGRPEWALVKLGRLKGRATLVPLTRARPSEQGVAVHVGRDVIADAPEIDARAEPSDQQVDALYRHYGIDIPSGSSDGHPASNGNGAAAPHTSSHGADDLRDAPLGAVVHKAKDDAQTLVTQELRLAKAEMTEKAKDVGIGAGLAGGAGYIAYLASIAFTLTLIFALAEVMPTAVAALIVTVLLGAVAAGLALRAKKKIQQAGPPIPEQTVESIKQTIQTVKEEATWGLGQTR